MKTVRRPKLGAALGLALGSAIPLSAGAQIAPSITTPDKVETVFLEQQAHGFDVWAQPMAQLRLPMLFNLRSDPFERAQHEAGDYVKWFVDHAFVVVPAQGIVAQHLQSFVDFPPRQRPGSFSVDQAMEKLRAPMSNN